MDVKAILGGREFSYCIVLSCLCDIMSLQLSTYACFNLRSRLVITGNTPDQDLLVGVVSWGLG